MFPPFSSDRPLLPTHQVFALFDKLILLAPVGEQVYYGSTHEAVKYFSSPALNFAFHKGANPAEFVMSASQVRADNYTIAGSTLRERGDGRLTTHNITYIHPQGGLLTCGGLRRGVHELAQLYRTSDLFQQVC